MDNRWRFLYCRQSELWGRMCELPAGREKTGTSAGGAGEGNPPCGPESVRWTETRVGKGREDVPGKAAMELSAPVPQTDTGGWGENPKAGGRSIVKELGKTAP